jgi:hypothetical protein
MLIKATSDAVNGNAAGRVVLMCFSQSRQIPNMPASIRLNTVGALRSDLELRSKARTAKLESVSLRSELFAIRNLTRQIQKLDPEIPKLLKAERKVLAQGQAHDKTDDSGTDLASGEVVVA